MHASDALAEASQSEIAVLISPLHDTVLDAVGKVILGDCVSVVIN